MPCAARAGQIGGGRAPVTPCGTGMWCWSASSVGVERGGCGGYRVEGGLGVDRRARSQIGDVEGEDLALARAAVWYSKPPQGLVPQRVVGVEEGEQLGRGDGPGARTCAARSDRGRRRSRPVAGEVGSSLAGGVGEQRGEGGDYP